MKYDFDCVVIGAGFAGMTAAIYLKRANVKVLLIDKDAPGGILNKIKKIENYPGYLDISGPDLAYKVYEQVKSLDIEIRYGNVLEINDHIIKTDLEEISANKIILALGRKPRTIKDTKTIENISYCVTCDANLYKDKTIALVTSSNNDDIAYLSSICKKVYVISNNKLSNEINYKNIEVLDDCVIETLKTEKNILNEIVTNKGNFKIDGMFISLGYEPHADFLNKIKKENGYILVNDKMQTNVDYIFACGDIIKKDFYQLTTAASEACIAALNIKRLLTK